MSYQPFGDTLALCEFVYKVYRRVWVVARDAPDDFRNLLDEVEHFKKQLAEIIYLTGQGDEITASTIRRCKRVLEPVEVLVAKYEKLSFSERGLGLRRLQWAKDKEKIEKCKRDIRNVVQSVLLYEQGRRLERIEQLVREGATYGQVESPVLPLGPEDDGYDSDGSFASARESQSSTPFPDEVKVDKPRAFEFQETPRRAVRTSTLQTGTTLVSSRHPASTLQTSSCKRSNTNETSPGISSDLSEDDHQSARSAQVSDFSTSPQKQSQQYIVLWKDELESLGHSQIDIPQDIKASFQAYIKDEELIGVWVKRAAWWILKAHELSRILRVTTVTETTTGDWPESITQQQNYVDLLKSEFILRNVVLARLVEGSKILKTEWKSIQDINDKIRQALKEWGMSLRIEDPKAVSFRLWESLIQPVESVEHGLVSEALDTLQPIDKWMATNIDDLGSERENEKALFRTFVNAQIGSRQTSRKSSTAPYMLVAWVRRPRARIQLSLLNQSGTIHLTRLMTHSDLEDYTSSNRPRTEYEFNFPSQRVVLKFKDKSHIDSLLNILSEFIEATAGRKPRLGEFLIFREGLTSCGIPRPLQYAGGDRRNSVTQAPNIRDNEYCEVSLFEEMPGELWKTTRRLVFTSIPGSDPWCQSYWLPLSRVQVQRDERRVKLVWSDFSHLRKRSQDYYQTWALVYDPEKPVVELEMLFENAANAEAFADSILYPFDTPFEDSHINKVAFWPLPKQVAQIWKLTNLTETYEKGYLALVVADTRPSSNHSSEVYYLYRYFDFYLEQNEPTLIFPKLKVSHYISDRDQEVTKPPSSTCATCREVERREKDAKLHFESKSQILSFFTKWMGASLLYLSHIPSAKFVGKLFSGVDYYASILMAWRGTDNHINLSIRTKLEDPSKKWVTMALEQPVIRQDKGQRELEVKVFDFQHGKLLDGASVRAISLDANGNGKSHSGKFVFSFGSQEERDRFSQVLG